MAGPNSVVKSNQTALDSSVLYSDDQQICLAEQPPNV